MQFAIQYKGKEIIIDIITWESSMNGRVVDGTTLHGKDFSTPSRREINFLLIGFLRVSGPRR